MKRCSIAGALSLGAFAVLGLAVQAQATLRTTNPALDLKADYFTVPNSGGIPTSSTWITVWGSNYAAPSWGAPATIHPFPPFPAGGAPFGFAINTFTDYIILGGPVGMDWSTSTARYAAAAAYITYDDSSTTAGNMTVTTIYGVDTLPFTPDAMAIAGYNTSTGVIPLLGEEQVTGSSGTVYNAGPGQLMPIGALPTILGPGADTSPFVGDPNAPVWVFQTTMPFAEAVPEPATFSLVAMAATGLLANRRRKA